MVRHSLTHLCPLDLLIGRRYCDARQVCLKPLDILASTGQTFYAVLSKKPTTDCMSNAFIGAVKDHPILKKTVDLVCWNIEHEHYGIDCIYPTGPGALFQGAEFLFYKNDSRSLTAHHRRCHRLHQEKPDAVLHRAIHPSVRVSDGRVHGFRQREVDPSKVQRRPGCRQHRHQGNQSLRGPLEIVADVPAGTLMRSNSEPTIGLPCAFRISRSQTSSSSKN
jgi:hypothetical protein